MRRHKRRSRGFFEKRPRVKTDGCLRADDEGGGVFKMCFVRFLLRVRSFWCFLRSALANALFSLCLRICFYCELYF